MLLFLFIILSFGEIDDSFSFFLCVPHRLIRSARVVLHIENHQIASIHHLPVADLIGSLGMVILSGITDLDFVIIGRETFPVVPQFRCGIWQYPYKRAVVCSYAALEPLHGRRYDLVEIPAAPDQELHIFFL